MSDHYRTLGLEPGARPDEIRAAYIAHMKQHHPDAAHASADASKAFAAELNRAYFVLRDPVRRMDYDATLTRARRQSEAAMARATFHAAPAGHFASAGSAAPRRRGSRRRILAILAAVAGAILWYSEWRPSLPDFISDRSLARVKWTGGEDSASSAQPLRPIPVDEANVAASIDDFEWIMANGTIGDGVTYSQHCWEDFRWNAGIDFFDRCAAFDFAAGLWGTRAEVTMPAYFASAARATRHGKALKRISSAAYANGQHLQELERQVAAAMAASNLADLDTGQDIYGLR